jgi:hypothetical protein
MAGRVGANLLDVEGPAPSSPTAATVTSTSAAQVLLDPERRRYLEPFLGRELTAAQAARELGLPVEQLAYRVRALTRQGLLTETGRQPRKGRAMTLYRAADELQAPLALLPYSDVRGFFELVDAGLRGLFLDGLGRLADRSGLRDWVVRFYRAGDGSTRLDLAPSGGSWDPAALLADRAPAVAFNWVPLALDDAAAKELQRELLALVGRYAAAASPSPTHLLGLFLSPHRP